MIMITNSIVFFVSLPFPNNRTFLSSPGPQLPAPCQEGEETLLGRQGGDGAAEDGAGVEAGAGAPCILFSLTCGFFTTSGKCVANNLFQIYHDGCGFSVNLSLGYKLVPWPRWTSTG